MPYWELTLECGHTVRRKVMKRKSDGHWRQAGEDPAPEWVYCEQCAAEGETETGQPTIPDGAPPPPWSHDEER